MIDGLLEDWESDVREELLRSAGLPLSVIFVAIGDRSVGTIPFEVRGDSQLLHRDRSWQVRNNLSFVHYQGQKGHVLLNDALSEVQRQMVEYHMSNGLHPKDIDKK